MELSKFFDLSLAVQVALGAGYLSYVTAYAGYRNAHGAQDAVFITLCFAAIGSLVFAGADVGHPLRATVAAVGVSLAAAMLWRMVGRSAWHWLMRTLLVHRDDGVHSAWTAIVQADREVGQISVHLNDGRVLYLSDRTNYKDAPWEGVYLGGDGAVLMIVEKEEKLDGTIEEREDIADEEWGTRLTYIPASSIARVNIRLK